MFAREVDRGCRQQAGFETSSVELFCLELVCLGDGREEQRGQPTKQNDDPRGAFGPVVANNPKNNVADEKVECVGNMTSYGVASRCLMRVVGC
eukprot:scaffold6634_cov158-Amphora_coffeaeformis.AAC.3